MAANTKMAGLTEGLDENTLLEIKNIGKSPLVFFVADKAEAPIPANAITIAAGETTTVKSETISNGTYGQLIVANQTGNDSSFLADVLE